MSFFLPLKRVEENWWTNNTTFFSQISEHDYFVGFKLGPLELTNYLNWLIILIM